MNLLYITWGERIDNHMQTIFSIITAFRYRDSFKNIYIITDYPKYYTSLGDSVHIIEINKTILDNWMGPEKFIFNIKIKGIAHFNELYPNEDVFYADSDTFFYTSPLDISISLQNNKAFMHLNEGTFGERLKKSGTMRRVFPILKNLKREDLGLKQSIIETTCMYNAGIIALPAYNMGNILKQVSLLTNYFLSIKELKTHYLEQLAFSLVIEDNYELHDCEYCVGHYWDNKEEWQENISNFLLKGFFCNYGINDFVGALSVFNFDIPIGVRQHSMNRKLTKKLDALFPKKFKYLERK